MRGYLDLLRLVLETGERREDRTGTGTLSIFGAQVHYDLRDGFPLVTTKKVAFSAIVHELLWFLKGSTNINDGLAEHTPIWNQWAAPDGELGPIYGASLRRWEAASESTVLVQIRKQEDSALCPITAPALPITDSSDDLVGQVITNTSGLEFVVISKEPHAGKNSRYLVQFLKSGFTRITGRPNVRNGQIKDLWSPVVANVGYIGSDVGSDVAYKERAYTLWRNMIVRCYDLNNPNYCHYGAKGTTVSNSWHNFSQFLQDLPQVPFFLEWNLNSSELALDKDYYGSNQYSKTTTLFLDTRTNLTIMLAKPVRCGEQVFYSIKNAGDYYDLDTKRLGEHLLGIRKNSKYTGFEYAVPPTGYLYRPRRVVDQLTEVVNNIKIDPFSRRHIISMWNVGRLSEMALPPCHTLVQFYVSGAHLDCQLYQRSADLALGVPYNIASYALLLSMIAKECGLTPRYFVHTLGDAHIYLNHITGVEEQLERAPLSLSRLVLADKPVLEQRFEDIQLEDYQHHPFIKFEVSV